MKFCFIVVSESETASTPGEGCRVDVHCDERRISICLPKRLIEGSESNFDGLLKWYIEDFAVKHPFETAKAAKASEHIRTYASNLHKALRLDSLIPREGHPFHVVLQVCEPPEKDVPFHRVRWEVLENLDFFSCSSQLSSVAVVRVVSQRRPPGSPSGIQPLGDKLRILAITARPRDPDGIPHQLITKPIYNTLQALKDAPSREIDFRIVRPGTFNALMKQLKGNWGKGYHQVLHLDVYGSAKNGSAFLHFDAEQPPKGDTMVVGEDGKPRDLTGSRGHSVSVEDVAKSLAQWGVKTVVLNVRQCVAEGQQQEANLARILIQHGIETVVATTYRLSEPAAVIFTQAFYYYLLQFDLPPLLAVQAARQQLVLRRERATPFGTRVQVYDYLVPVIYRHNLLGAPAQLPTYVSPQVPLSIGGEWVIGEGELELVGREGLLLQLELHLCLREPICSLIGPAGVGKSALAKYACEWWMCTGFIDRFIILRNSDTLLVDLCKEFGIETTPTEPIIDAIVRKMKGEKYLFVLDAFETSHADQSPPYRGIERISKKTGCYVLILSRTREQWHNNLGQTSQDVPELLPLHVVTLGTQIIKNRGNLKMPSNPVDTNSQRELEAIEQIGKLARGNPLALKLILDNFCSQHLPAEKYFALLMRGRGIRIDARWLEKTQGSHSIRELQALVDASDHAVVSPRLLLPFWDKVSWKELKHYYYWSVKNNDKHDYQRPRTTRDVINAWVCANPPKAFSEEEMNLMFVDSIKFPEIHDDWDDSEYPITPSSSDNGGCTTAFSHQLLQPEGVCTASNNKEYLKYEMALEAARAMRSKFVGANFIYEVNVDFKTLSPEGRATSSVRPYLRMHPLLPLVLRDARQASYSGVLHECKMVVPRWFAYRAKMWPNDKLSFLDDWQVPQCIIDTEFLNFLSAAYFILYMDPSLISITLLIRICVLVQKGNLGDRSRHALLASFWEMARLRLVSKANALKGPEDLLSNFGESEPFLNREIDEFSDADSGSEIRPSQSDSHGEMVTWLSRLFSGETRKPRARSRLQTSRYQVRDLVRALPPSPIMLQMSHALPARYNFWLGLGLVFNSKYLRNLDLYKAFNYAAKVVWKATKSRKPPLSLLMEITAMLLTLNLSNYYDGFDDQRPGFYLVEAKKLRRERTRIPLLDRYVRQNYSIFIKLLAMSTQATHAKTLFQIMKYRERLYQTLGLLGRDISRHVTGTAMPNVTFLGGMTGINSLMSPDENVLTATVAALEYLSGNKMDEAQRVLEQAMGAEGRKPNRPYNTAYLFRALSQVAVQKEDWSVALKQWKRALEIEKDAGYTKSWWESFSESSYTRTLRRKV